MKYDALRKFADKYGFEIFEDEFKIGIWDKEKIRKATITKYIICQIDIFDLFDFKGLDDEKLLAEIYGIFTKIGRTPMNDREEEKLYYVRNTFVRTAIGYTHLSLDDNGFLYIDCRTQKSGTQTQFTQKEIDEMDLSKDWEKVPVEVY